MRIIVLITIVLFASVIGLTFYKSIARADNFEAKYASAPVLEILRSADTERMEKAIIEFAKNGPENYGPDNKKIIDKSLASNSPVVQRYALVSLHRLLLSDDGLVDKSYYQERIKQLLSSSDPELQKQASSLLAMFFSESRTANMIRLDEIKSTEDPVRKAALLRDITPEAAGLVEVQKYLMTLVTKPADVVSVSAADALLRAVHPPDELLPELIRLAQNNRFYGRQSLVRGVMRYGDKAKPYLGALKAIREELAVDLTKSYKEREKNVSWDGKVLNVDSDPYALTVLDQAIEQLNN